ncbi:MAG: DUF1127 domain-containing protein, partial [Pseudomonadota bacterium]|nr:DUF1127 domain-containing protein [Pseudomonadota bacterium]
LRQRRQLADRVRQRDEAFAIVQVELRQRRQLAQLDAAALQDMGLTQADVDFELKRSAWDVPSHWRG